MRGYPEKPINPMDLVDALYEDVMAVLPELRRELSKDVQTIRTRFAREGFFFLGVALADLGKCFLIGLDTGHLPKSKYFGGRPAFGRWALRPWFSVDGSMIIEPPDSIVRNFLQICFLFKKTTSESSESAERRETNKFFERNASLADHVFKPNFLACNWIRKVFADFSVEKLRFKNGSGAIFEKRRDKLNHFRLCMQSEGLFPAKQFLFGSDGYSYNAVSIRPLDFYRSRLCTVPKDVKGPRLIAIEMAQAMYLQQGIMRYMYKCLKRNGIDLEDQMRMRRLTSNPNYVTIDFSAASDSISVALVKHLFSQTPELLDALFSVRSQAIVYDGRECDLNIFGTMGNATTFAVLTTTLAALGRGRGLRVHVYGDDVIVHKDDYEQYKHEAHSVGFQINTAKTFSGRIRESCGIYRYRGKDITPFYIRTLSGKGMGHWSLNETSNQARSLFFLHLSDCLLNHIERARGRLPYVGRGRTSYMSVVNPRDRFSRYPITKRWCSHTQQYLFKGWVPEITSSVLTYENDHLPYAYTLATTSEVAKTTSEAKRLVRRVRPS